MQNLRFSSSQRRSGNESGCRFYSRHRARLVEVVSCHIEEYGARLRDVTTTINTNYNVDGLCRGFPARLKACMERGGDRVMK